MSGGKRAVAWLRLGLIVFLSVILGAGFWGIGVSAPAMADPAPTSTPAPNSAPSTAPVSSVSDPAASSGTPTPAPTSAADPTPGPEAVGRPSSSPTAAPTPSADSSSSASTDPLDASTPPPAPPVADQQAAPTPAIAPKVVALAVIPNANIVLMAWVGTPAQRPVAGPVLTLQAALNAAAAGQTVSFDPNDYVFTTPLTVPRAVTLDTSTPSTLFAQFTISGGGLSASTAVAFGVSATGAVFTVNPAGAIVSGLTVVNPNGVARPTGIQLGVAATGVQITNFTMDGGGQALSYGVNLTTGSATVTNPSLTGVATGIGVTATSTAAGIAVIGGSFTVSTAGIALGATAGAHITGVTITGPGAAGTGIDLANSSGAVISTITLANFARGIGANLTNSAAGPTITDASITGISREGIALGTTAGARITTSSVAGTGVAASNGINLYLATGVVLDRPVVSNVAYGIYTNIGNAGAGPQISSPLVTDVTSGGITLGSTQGATITSPQISGGSSATGVNLMNAGRVSVSDATLTGMLYGIATTSQVDATSDRANITLTNLTVTGAPNASSGISLLGAVNATVSNLRADITGGGIVVHDSTDVQANGVTVTGHEGPTPAAGAAILKAYDSHNVNVTDSAIDAGSYGFFYSATDGSTVTNAQVSNVVQYAIYGRSVGNLDVSAATFTNNRAVGNLVVTTLANGVSHDINIHNATMTDNQGGLNLYTGTSSVQFTNNTVTRQPYVILAAPAHDVTIANNTVSQTGAADQAAIMVTPLYEDGANTGSYSSSGLVVRDNTFSGSGTWIQVGSPQPTPDAANRTLRNPVLVVGNTFPAASAAVRTYPNAVLGDDTITAAAVTRAANGPIAVDARDYNDPNDWGSVCKATGFLDGNLVYAGGGAAVYELTAAPVLYPTNCIDLSLTEAVSSPAGTPFHGGDTVTWTLTPHNAGPRAAPAGWSITQLLPLGVELVSMSGQAYTINGSVATASNELPADSDGPTLTVIVRIDSIPAGTATMKDVAYIAFGSPTDLDGDGYVDVMIERNSPLVVPTLATDTDASPTDNDAQGVWAVESDAVPPGSNTPTGSGTLAGFLASTGLSITSLAAFAFLLIGVGGALFRRPRCP